MHRAMCVDGNAGIEDEASGRRVQQDAWSFWVESARPLHAKDLARVGGVHLGPAARLQRQPPPAECAIWSSRLQRPV